MGTYRKHKCGLVGLLFILLLLYAAAWSSEPVEKEKIILINDFWISGSAAEGLHRQQVSTFSVNNEISLRKRFYINAVTSYSKNFRYVNPKHELVYVKSYFLRRSDEFDNFGIGTTDVGVLVHRNLENDQFREETFYNAFILLNDKAIPMEFYLTNDPNRIIGINWMTKKRGFQLINVKNAIRGIEKSVVTFYDDAGINQFSVSPHQTLINPMTSPNNKMISYFSFDKDYAYLNVIKYPAKFYRDGVARGSAFIKVKNRKFETYEKKWQPVPRKRWSPDGSKILYTGTPEGIERAGIYILNLKTGKTDKILSIGKVSSDNYPYLDWTEKGIVITCPDAVYAAMNGSRKPDKILLPDNLTSFENARLSPSGKKLMFIARSTVKREFERRDSFLCVLNMDTRKLMKYKLNYTTCNFQGAWFVKGKTSIIESEFLYLRKPEMKTD